MSDFDADFQAWIDGGQEGAMPSPGAAPIKRKTVSVRRKAADADEFEDMGRLVATFVRETVAPLAKRIEALESRLQESRYIGQWSEGLKAVAGNSVSHAGSIWIAMRTTTEKPGVGDSGWQLAVKRGRDGRDAK